MNLPKIEPIIWRGKKVEVIQPQGQHMLVSEQKDILHVHVDSSYKLDGKERLITTQPIVQVTLPEAIEVPLSATDKPLQHFIGHAAPLYNITELETYFKRAELSIQSVKLNAWTTILDIQKFIQSHLAMVRKYNGTNVSKPYYNRLIELKAYLN